MTTVHYQYTVSTVCKRLNGTSGILFVYYMYMYSTSWFALALITCHSFIRKKADQQQGNQQIRPLSQTGSLSKISRSYSMWTQNWVNNTQEEYVKKSIRADNRHVQPRWCSTCASLWTTESGVTTYNAHAYCVTYIIFLIAGKSYSNHLPSMYNVSGLTICGLRVQQLIIHAHTCIIKGG